MPRVVVVNDASTARGGATGLALLQARLLKDRGIDVAVFAADRDPNPDLAASGIAWHNAGTDPLTRAPPLTAATRGMYSRPVHAALTGLIAATDTPDTIYHVHSWSKALTASAFTALRPVARRTLIHAHDYFLACPNGGYMDYRADAPCTRVPLSAACLATNCDKRSYAQKMWRTARQMALRRATVGADWGGVLMIHPGMEPGLARGGWAPGDLHTLRNPATALTRDRIRAEDNIGLVFVGRVETEKGVEDAIAAAALADIPLTIIGDGPLRAPLAARHPEVAFTGWLDRAGIAVHIATARALVMPSRYPEPFGLVAAEASLSGLPVIAAQTALLAPEIAEYGLGLSCDTRDIAAFAAAMREIADMPHGRIEAMSRNAASGAAGLCTTPATWIDAQIDHYDRLLA